MLCPSDQASDLANQATEGYKKAAENAGEWVDRGRAMYGQAKDAVSRGADLLKLADIADISGFMKKASLAG